MHVPFAFANKAFQASSLDALALYAVANIKVVAIVTLFIMTSHPNSESPFASTLVVLNPAGENKAYRLIDP